MFVLISNTIKEMEIKTLTMLVGLCQWWISRQFPVCVGFVDFGRNHKFLIYMLEWVFFEVEDSSTFNSCL